MKVFVAGIMQGSLQGDGLYDQGYRQQIAAVVHAHFPTAQVIDPWALHPASLDYDDELAQQTFFHFCQLAGHVDLLIAYLPEASIGTAVEMWEAHRHRVPVIAVTPMAGWSVRFLSWRLCRSIDELDALLERETIPVTLGRSEVDGNSLP